MMVVVSWWAVVDSGAVGMMVAPKLCGGRGRGSVAVDGIVM